MRRLKRGNKATYSRFVLSYYYALEIYSIFEDKFVSNNPDLKQDIVSLIQAYIKIFNDDLLYIDLLLEYIQKI